MAHEIFDTTEEMALGNSALANGIWENGLHAHGDQLSNGQPDGKLSNDIHAEEIHRSDATANDTQANGAYSKAIPVSEVQPNRSQGNVNGIHSNGVLKHEIRASGAHANESLPLVVALEGLHLPIPRFDFPHEYIEHYNTSPSEILDRVKNATIIVTNICVITPEVASQCPNLRHVAILATGCGWVEREWFTLHGITVTNTPKCNIEAVSEHTIGLYFAARKKIPQLHQMVVGSDQWAKKGTLTKQFETGPPRSCNAETVGIIGYGPLGQGIEQKTKALGMGKVLIAERKGAPPEQTRPGRIPFGDLLRMTTVLVIACPKDASTINLIDEAELKMMREDAVIINVARGGIVNEDALAMVLRKKQIAGAATDVLEVEPPNSEKCPLLPVEGEEPVPNLTISPHNAWFSGVTIENYQRKFKTIVESFAAGEELDTDCVVANGRASRS